MASETRFSLEPSTARILRAILLFVAGKYTKNDIGIILRGEGVNDKATSDENILETIKYQAEQIVRVIK